MNIKQFSFIFVSFLLAILLVSFASATLTFNSLSSQTVSAGSIANFSLTLNSDSDVLVNLSANGWAFNPSQILVPASGSNNSVASLQIPSNLAGGQYSYNITALNSSSGLVIASVIAVINVPFAQISSIPSTVQSISNGTISFQINNTGNVPLTLSAGKSGVIDFAYSFYPSSYVAPGSIATVTAVSGSASTAFGTNDGIISISGY
ncbi:MAG: hypothetical protein AABX66_02115, partial [Nanoarchaeota archaeon]